jgi:predicted permease
MWQQRFKGDPAIAGKVIEVSGYPYTVAGVAARGFHGLDQIIDPQFWVPLDKVPELTLNAPHATSRRTQWLNISARLKPGVSRDDASRELAVIAERLAQQYPETDKGNGFMVEEIGSVPGRTRGPMRLFLFGLSTVALLVLCIACANVANILLAQGAQRQRELAVRLALGSTRGRLVRQMLIESLLLALGGGVVGVLLSVWATYALSSFHLPVPMAMDLSVRVDWRTVAYAFGLSFIAGFLCGMAPALASARVAVAPALKGEEALARAGSRWSLRSVLVVAQMTLSLVLLCGTGLFLRSLQNAMQINTGFVSRGTVMVSVDPQLHRYTPQSAAIMLNTARERMSSLPGVVSATVGDAVPLSMGHRSDGFEVPGMPKPDGDNVVELYMVGPDYLKTLGIPLLAGRAVGEENPNAPRVGVVNQEFVRRYFRGANPIGHIANGAGIPYTIIGVMGNIKSRTIGEDERPVLFRAINQNIASDSWQNGYTFIVRYEGDPATLGKAMENAIHTVDPSLAVYNVRTMEDHMRDALFLPRLVNSIFFVFGITGVSLAAIGLYGVMSYTVSRRTKEIGIRMALGARARQVQGMFIEGGLWLTGLSIVLGVPLALAAARLTGTLLYGIKSWDVATFVVVPLLLLAVALLACWLPSRRASRIDPMEALRVE